MRPLLALGPLRGSQRVFELIGTDICLCFAIILEHSGQLKKPWIELLENPGCLSGEIMTQAKKKKAIEKLRVNKRSK